MFIALTSAFELFSLISFAFPLKLLSFKLLLLILLFELLLALLIRSEMIFSTVKRNAINWNVLEDPSETPKRKISNVHYNQGWQSGIIFEYIGYLNHHWVPESWSSQSDFPGNHIMGGSVLVIGFGILSFPIFWASIDATFSWCSLFGRESLCWDG